MRKGWKPQAPEKKIVMQGAFDKIFVMSYTLHDLLLFLYL